MAKKAMTLVGLDVHARQTHAAILDPVRVVTPGSIPKEPVIGSRPTAATRSG